MTPTSYERGGALLLQVHRKRISLAPNANIGAWEHVKCHSVETFMILYGTLCVYGTLK